MAHAWKPLALGATALALASLASAGSFRMKTNGMVGDHDQTVVQRADPIITPGKLSQHAHDFFGSSAMNPNQTYEQLRAGQCTTLAASDAPGHQVIEDMSVYWYPALYMKRVAGGYRRVAVNGRAVYYHDFGPEPLEDFPAGFRMIAGTPSLRNMTLPDNKQNIVEWSCSNTGRGAPQPGFKQLDSLSQCDGWPNYMVRMEFPHCWNGVPYDPASPTSHMKYPEGPDVMGGECPEGFQHKLPHLEVEISFHVGYQYTNADGSPDPVLNEFILAHGDPTGMGFHMDYQFGWPEGLVPKLLNANVPGSEFNIGLIRDNTDLLQKNTPPASECELPHFGPDYEDEYQATEANLPGCNLPPTFTNNPPKYPIVGPREQQDNCAASTMKQRKKRGLPRRVHRHGHMHFS